MNPAERSLSANLDLLRAIAVVLVLAQHLAHRMYVENFAGMPTSSWGVFGVLLFFVHTCLVLMYSMERSRLTGWHLLTNFATRRIFRIYPLSILAVLTALALHLDSDINGIRGLSHGQFPGIVSTASNLLLVQNLTQVKSIVNVLWSLPFELQMYAFLPFLFLWIRRSSTSGAPHAARASSGRSSRSGSPASAWLRPSHTSHTSADSPSFSSSPISSPESSPMRCLTARASRAPSGPSSSFCS